MKVVTRARGIVRVVLVSLLALGACAHTKTTDAEARKEASPAEEHRGESAAPANRAASTLHPGDPAAVPVATGPEALLVPGAEDQVRDKLVAGGFLSADADKSAGASREGIRRFQKARELPATGIIDNATAKALGLDPNKIFRHGTATE